MPDQENRISERAGRRSTHIPRLRAAFKIFSQAASAILASRRTLRTGEGGPVSESNTGVAGRKKAEEERSLLASIVDSSNDAILGKTLDGTITSWNRAAEKLYGYGVEEVVGRSITMLIPEDRPDEMTEILAQIHQGEKVDHRETVRVAKDGRRIDVEITVSPIRDSFGKISGASTIARDIGERRRAEEALQEREEQLRLALDASSLGTWHLDLDSGEFVSSPRASAIHGLPDEDRLDNRGALEAVHPEDREAVERKVERAISERGSYRAEYRVARPDGTIRWVGAYGRVYGRGRGGRLIGVVRDVTERKEVEERLKEGEQRFQSLTDAALEGIAIIEQGKILEVNRACADMFGYEPSEIVGKPVLDFVAPESRDLVRRNASSGSEQAYEAIGIRKDGSRFVQELHGRVSVYRGRSVRVIAIRDITERKRAEAELTREREFLAAVLGSLKEGIVACDAGGKLTLFNQATQEFHGITEQEIGPDEWAGHYSLYQADGHTPMRQEEIPLFRAYSGENVRDVEMVIAPEDGPVRTLLANGQAFYDGEGNKLGAVVAMHDVTEQKRIEEELRESERQFRALTGATLEAIVIAEQGKILEVNWAYTALFGYETSEIVGEYALRTTAPESRDLVRDKIASSSEDSYEAVGLRKDGTRFDIELHGTNSMYRGRPVRVTAIRDITERKRAEAEIRELTESLERRVEERTAELQAAVAELRENEQRLRQSEDRLRLAAESTGLGTWDFDLATGELKWDDRCKAVFGLPSGAEVDYETFLSGLHPEDRERTDRMVRVTLEHGSGGYFDTEYRTIGIDDGVERWVAAHGQVFFDESGRAVRFIGTLLDITERKRAENVLRKSEERYRSLFQSNPDAVYELDLEGRFVSVNPAMEETSGYGLDELKGTVSGDYVLSQHREAAMQHFAAVRRGSRRVTRRS